MPKLNLIFQTAAREIPAVRDETTHYLSVVSMFQNEAAYLNEWLAFCLAQGVGHVLLYDNGSTDDSRAVLRPWIELGFVEIIDWPVPFESAAQLKAYNDALERVRGRTRWAAFIDVDEFLFSPSGFGLPEVLNEYEEYAGVIVNWQCYGSSGHRVRPSGLTIENYVRRARTQWRRNRRMKTIIDPSRTLAAQSVHMFFAAPGASIVTEQFELVKAVRRGRGRRTLRHLAAWLPYLPVEPYAITECSIDQVSVTKLRINHYVTRSEEESRAKYKDRNSMGSRDRRSYTRYHDRNEVEDPVLASRGAEVREIIAAVHAGSLPEKRDLGDQVCFGRPLQRRHGLDAE